MEEDLRQVCLDNDVRFSAYKIGLLRPRFFHLTTSRIHEKMAFKKKSETTLCVVQLKANEDN